MLKNNDVPTMMARVQTALVRGARARPPRSLVVVSESTKDELGISALRRPARIEIEFHSGSARPFVGRGIQFGKRVVRRGLRWYISPIADQQSRFNTASLDVDEKLLAQHEALATEVADLRDQQDRLEQVVDGLRADLEAARAGAGAGAAVTPSPSARAALAYSAFEDRHRGSDEDVTRLLEPYVEPFRGRARVVDIGCGRGEFLALLARERVSAYGVDSDSSMVQTARAKGLDVVEDDGVAHLRSLSAGDVDGVFASQVAEHLTTDELVQLVDLAYRKLAPGGVLVMETPNPETLFIFSAFFYTDLTHVRPIHPEALRWACESAGFGDVQVIRSQPVPESARLAPLPDDVAAQPGWQTVARNTDMLNDLIFGPQHYAVVAHKPQELR